MRKVTHKPIPGAVRLILGLMAVGALVFVSGPRMLSARALAGSNSSPAAMLAVTTTDDHDDGACNSDCSLREAIRAALSQDATIVFNVTGTINLAGALPEIARSMSIEGPGANLLTVRRNTGGEYSIFDVSAAGTVSFSGLTINNGAAEFGAGIENFNAGTIDVRNCVLSDNIAGDAGAAIDNRDGGTINITDSTLRDNNADVAGGIMNQAAGTVNITNSTITANLARRHGGGGIYNASNGTVNLTNSIISDNTSQGFGGGGISNFANGVVSIIQSTIKNNVSGFKAGGGIFNGPGTMTITNSTISGNSAKGGGGGVFNGTGGSVLIVNSTVSGNKTPTDEFGGGGLSNDGTTTVINSTFAGNSVLTGGGAIFNFGSATVSNCTISRNTAAGTPHSSGDGAGIENAGAQAVQVKSTIIAMNTGPGSKPDVTGAFSSAGFNLIGKTTPDAGFTALTDLTGTVGSPLDPGLDPSGLQDNGGPTQTIALVCGSPAIDKGTSNSLAGSLDADQRGAGFPRTVDDLVTPNAAGGDGTDIGAFELSQDCNHAPVARCRNIQVSAGSGCQATIIVANVDNGSFDPDQGDSIATRVLDNSGPFGLGPHSVLLTVTDTHGASSSCNAIVTVLDSTPPTITCPANITTKTSGPGSSTVSVIYPPPSATDNCSTPSVVCSPASGSQFPLGSTTVICTATDAANNVASCSFTVTLFDVCVQDDTTRDTLLLDSHSGDYLFVRCGAGGFSLSGRGSVRVVGSLFTLDHSASDRRVTARIDNIQKKGVASVQRFGQPVTITITDKNTVDNSCACP